MIKNKCFLLFIFLLLLLPNLTYATPSNPYESIQTIEGEVNQHYKKLGLVWRTHRKSDKALSKLKKDAAKLGADAIIHFKVIAPVAFGWAVKWVSPEEAKQAKENEAMPILFGKPERPYQEINPIWKSHKKINKAYQKLIKMAQKKGADAIINFQIGNYQGTTTSITPQGMVVSSSFSIPTLQGIAVKWTK